MTTGWHNTLSVRATFCPIDIPSTTTAFRKRERERERERGEHPSSIDTLVLFCLVMFCFMLGFYLFCFVLGPTCCYNTAIVEQTNTGTVSKTMLERPRLLRDGLVRIIWALPGATLDWTELNWTEKTLSLVERLLAFLFLCSFSGGYTWRAALEMNEIKKIMWSSAAIPQVREAFLVWGRASARSPPSATHDSCM